MGALGRLPERDRQVATLRYLDGMEIQQIADDRR